MAESYRIVPMSVLDGIVELNQALAAYNALVEAWAQSAARGEPTGDPGSFALGLQHLSGMILDGYLGIESERDSILRSGLRVADGVVVTG